jgi:hypothetical protein
LEPRWPALAVQSAKILEGFEKAFHLDSGQRISIACLAAIAMPSVARILLLPFITAKKSLSFL